MQVTLDARDLLQSHGIAARVVSMPCAEWFAAQDLAYAMRFCRPASTRVSVLKFPWWCAASAAGRG